MSEIKLPIPPQNYELIRDRIASILYIELENQWVLTYDRDLMLPVWVERTIPFDHTEAPCVNVSLASGVFDNEDGRGSDGTYQFNIDVFAKAAQAGTMNGDQLATMKVHKILGKCRAILKNNAYIRLSFTPPSISRTTVSSLAIAEAGKKDAEHVMMGRLVFTVRVPEDVELKTANLIDGYDTAVKMLLTDKGYVFSGDNPDIPPPTCAPVTITINGVAYAVIASGVTRDINIEYLNGTQVPVTFDYETVLVPNPGGGGSAVWQSLWP